MKKIYFCGSIRGGRELATIYNDLVKFLHRYGEVLTEHVADKSVVSSETGMFTDNEIYERDRKWLEESDFVVAEVTIPSLGVGFEIGYAVKLKKPVLCLYYKEAHHNLSAMISGCPDIEVINYQQVPELDKPLGEFIKNPSHRIP